MGRVRGSTAALPLDMSGGKKVIKVCVCGGAGGGVLASSSSRSGPPCPTRCPARSCPPRRAAAAYPARPQPRCAGEEDGEQRESRGESGRMLRREKNGEANER